MSNQVCAAVYSFCFFFFAENIQSLVLNHGVPFKIPFSLYFWVRNKMQFFLSFQPMRISKLIFF